MPSTFRAFRGHARHVLLFALFAAVALGGCSGDDESAGARGPDRGTRTETDAGGRRPVATEDVGGGLDGDDSAADVGTNDTAASPEDSGAADDASADAGSSPDAPVAPVDPDGPAGAVTGTVWAPGNAPGMAPLGEEIPVAGALVYLTQTPPGAIPQRAYCAACVTPPGRSVLTDARGRFTLSGFAEGTWWLVVEKGQFRRVSQVDVVAGTTTSLTNEVTTLPSRNDPTQGMTTPRIAVAVGGSDHLEDILGKMGMGEVSTAGRFVPESADGVFDLWSNGGVDGGLAIGTLEELVRDPARLAEYHILFVPCSGDANARALRDQAVLRNLRSYVAGGGNLYVTDWSGEWFDNVFPAQVQLGEGIFGFFDRIDTPASAWNAATETWNTSQFGSADGDSYDSPNGEVVDPQMRDWLASQGGPNSGGGRSTTYNATNFRIEGNWNYIEAVHDVVVGRAADGTDVIDRPRVWVTGGRPGRLTPKQPMTVSFEPVGCGRVLFSTYHTTDDVHVGLVPQERILLYLIMEIGTCRNPKE